MILSIRVDTHIGHFGTAWPTLAERSWINASLVYGYFGSPVRIEKRGKRGTIKKARPDQLIQPDSKKIMMVWLVPGNLSGPNRCLDGLQPHKDICNEYHWSFWTAGFFAYVGGTRNFSRLDLFQISTIFRGYLQVSFNRTDNYIVVSLMFPKAAFHSRCVANRVMLLILIRIYFGHFNLL